MQWAGRGFGRGLGAWLRALPSINKWDAGLLPPGGGVVEIMGFGTNATNVFMSFKVSFIMHRKDQLIHVYMSNSTESYISS